MFFTAMSLSFRDHWRLHGSAQTSTLLLGAILYGVLEKIETALLMDSIAFAADAILVRLIIQVVMRYRSMWRLVS